MYMWGEGPSITCNILFNITKLIQVWAVQLSFRHRWQYHSWSWDSCNCQLVAVRSFKLTPNSAQPSASFELMCATMPTARSKCMLSAVTRTVLKTSSSWEGWHSSLQSHPVMWMWTPAKLRDTQRSLSCVAPNIGEHIVIRTPRSGTALPTPEFGEHMVSQTNTITTTPDSSGVAKL
jgi:hypothetical protein